MTMRHIFVLINAICMVFAVLSISDLEKRRVRVYRQLPRGGLKDIMPRDVLKEFRKSKFKGKGCRNNEVAKVFCWEKCTRICADASMEKIRCKQLAPRLGGKIRCDCFKPLCSNGPFSWTEIEDYLVKIYGNQTTTASGISTTSAPSSSATTTSGISTMSAPSSSTTMASGISTMSAPSSSATKASGISTTSAPSSAATTDGGLTSNSNGVVLTTT